MDDGGRMDHRIGRTVHINVGLGGEPLADPGAGRELPDAADRALVLHFEHQLVAGHHRRLKRALSMPTK